MKRLIILGAGGHGKVVMDIAQLTGRWEKIMVIDDRFPDVNSVLSFPVIGKISDAIKNITNDDDWFVAIGDGKVRLDLISRLMKSLKPPVTLIHPSAVISSHTKFEYGTVVMAGAVVNPACKIGYGSIINTCSSVDHDCILEEGVHICPGAHLGGDVSVGKKTWVGIGVVVKHGIAIGENVTVGAGATVINDVPDNLTVTGTPAKQLR